MKKHPDRFCELCTALIARVGGRKYWRARFCSTTCYRTFFAAITPDDYLLKRINKDGPNGCWIYTGATDRRGYGRPARKHKRYYAHRRSYEIHKGPIPAGMLVLHKCDNPPCCNPDHLFLGTDADNAQDKARKGRALDGANNMHAKLTEQQVIEIRALRGKTTQREASERYGVSQTAICAIFNRRTWKRTGSAERDSSKEQK